MTQPSALARWNAFWFTPRDPTLLGLMRILAGLVVLYTVIVHGLTLDQFMAERAWYDADSRRDMIRDRAVIVPALSGSESPAPAPANDFEKDYYETYLNHWGSPPPAPYPADEKDIELAEQFRAQYKFDFRGLGLPFPRTEDQKQYLRWYTDVFKLPSPGPYPPPGALAETLRILQDESNGKAINPRRLEADGVNDLYQIIRYHSRQQCDPRRLYERGTPVWSIWLEVTDPFWMGAVQAVFVIAAVFMLIGLGTRVAVPIVWFANLCYIHRSPVVLFGVDTMMNVLLLYFMIGPSGAALSVDRWLARRWWGAEARPLASAGFVYRLMQIHLCIIYLISGIAKLQGGSWWSGTAVWGVLANFEFAPMPTPAYRAALRWLGQNQLVFDSFITLSGHLTLVFEIGYPFLIWRPRTRRVWLAAAIMLHGGIGLFMGLKTFSLMMLVFNMAFLRPEETAWVLRRFRILPRSVADAPPSAEVEVIGAAKDARRAELR